MFLFSIFFRYTVKHKMRINIYVCMEILEIVNFIPPCVASVYKYLLPVTVSLGLENKHTMSVMNCKTNNV